MTIIVDNLKTLAIYIIYCKINKLIYKTKPSQKIRIAMLLLTIYLKKFENN